MLKKKSKNTALKLLGAALTAVVVVAATVLVAVTPPQELKETAMAAVMNSESNCTALGPAYTTWTPATPTEPAKCTFIQPVYFGNLTSFGGGIHWDGDPADDGTTQFMNVFSSQTDEIEVESDTIVEGLYVDGSSGAKLFTNPGFDVELRNVTVTNYNGYGGGIDINSDDVDLDDVTVTDSLNGLYIYNTEGNTAARISIRNSEFHNNTLSGIKVEGGIDIHLSNNKTNNNNIGITMGTGPFTVLHPLIYQHEATGNTSEGLVMNDSSNWWIDESSFCGNGPDIKFTGTNTPSVLTPYLQSTANNQFDTFDSLDPWVSSTHGTRYPCWQINLNPSNCEYYDGVLLDETTCNVDGVTFTKPVRLESTINLLNFTSRIEQPPEGEGPYYPWALYMVGKPGEQDSITVDGAAIYTDDYADEGIMVTGELLDERTINNVYIEADGNGILVSESEAKDVFTDLTIKPRYGGYLESTANKWGGSGQNHAGIMFANDNIDEFVDGLNAIGYRYGVYAQASSDISINNVVARYYDVAAAEFKGVNNLYVNGVDGCDRDYSAERALIFDRYTTVSDEQANAVNTGYAWELPVPKPGELPQNYGTLNSCPEDVKDYYYYCKHGYLVTEGDFYDLRRKEPLPVGSCTYTKSHFTPDERFAQPIDLHIPDGTVFNGANKYKVVNSDVFLSTNSTFRNTFVENGTVHAQQVLTGAAGNNIFKNNDVRHTVGSDVAYKIESDGNILHWNTFEGNSMDKTAKAFDFSGTNNNHVNRCNSNNANIGIDATGTVGMHIEDSRVRAATVALDFGEATARDPDVIHNYMVSNNIAMSGRVENARFEWNELASSNIDPTSTWHIDSAELVNWVYNPHVSNIMTKLVPLSGRQYKVAPDIKRMTLEKQKGGGVTFAEKRCGYLKGDYFISEDGWATCKATASSPTIRNDAYIIGNGVHMDGFTLEIDKSIVPFHAKFAVLLAGCTAPATDLTRCEGKLPPKISNMTIDGGDAVLTSLLIKADGVVADNINATGAYKRDAVIANSTNVLFNGGLLNGMEGAMRIFRSSDVTVTNTKISNGRTGIEVIASNGVNLFSNEIDATVLYGITIGNINKFSFQKYSSGIDIDDNIVESTTRPFTVFGDTQGVFAPGHANNTNFYDDTIGLVIPGDAVPPGPVVGEVRGSVAGRSIGQQPMSAKSTVELYSHRCAVKFGMDAELVRKGCKRISEHPVSRVDNRHAYFSIEAQENRLFFLVGIDPLQKDLEGNLILSNDPQYIHNNTPPFRNIVIAVTELAGVKVPMKSNKYLGSVLWVYDPSEILWTDTTATYPFAFESDSDWTVDVCLEVPEGYVIADGQDCQQAFVTGEVKVIEFTVNEVGSIPIGATAKFKLKGPDGKTLHVESKIATRMSKELLKKKSAELLEMGCEFDERGKLKKCDN